MEENNKIRSMEENNKIKTGDTFKIRITFDIDVPRNMEDSIFNSIIMGIYDYKMIKEDRNIPQKYKNKLLMNIQRETDNLLILNEKSR